MKQGRISMRLRMLVEYVQSDKIHPSASEKKRKTMRGVSHYDFPRY